MGRWLLAAAAAVTLLTPAAVAFWWLWTRPRLRSALAASVVLCLTVVVPWAVMANLTIGVPPGGWWRSYGALLAGPSGTPAQFAEVTGGLTVGCFLVAGWRSRRRKGGAR